MAIASIAQKFGWRTVSVLGEQLHVCCVFFSLEFLLEHCLKKALEVEVVSAKMNECHPRRDMLVFRWAIVTLIRALFYSLRFLAKF